ncbi:MAG: GtrA family protein [Enterococcus sp.]
MIGKIKSYLDEKGLWEMIIYIFFGGLTTLVNFAVFFLMREFLGINLIAANTVSWIASVLFAFITNKIWVFHSKTGTTKELILEFSRFIFYRLLSYGIDMGTMLFLTELLGTNEYVAKIITQIIVVLANYVFSKLFIFNQVEKLKKNLDDK